MLTGNECYVVIKLNTGEQLLCVLEQEDDEYIQILDPMIIKTTPVISEGREHVTAHPYCQFTGDNVYDIEKVNVIFMKPMLETMIPHYLRIIKDHEGSTVRTQKRAEDLDWGGEEKISKEEAIRRIQMLEDITGISVKENEEEILSYYIEGNDTKH